MVVGTTKIRVARKCYRCDERGHPIMLSENYEYMYGLFETWTTYRTCVPCLNVRNAHMGCWVYGRVWEDIRECLGDEVVPEFMTKDEYNKIAEQEGRN